MPDRQIDRSWMSVGRLDWTWLGLSQAERGEGRRRCINRLEAHFLERSEAGVEGATDTVHTVVHVGH